MYRAVILWLDNLDRYLAASALSVDLLSQWAATTPKITVLATIQAAEWGNWRFPSGERSEGRNTGEPRARAELGVDEVGEQGAAVLSHATTVELDRKLGTTKERMEATRRYGDHDWTTLGLGEVLAAGPELLKKLSGGRGQHPWGCAIAEAAADYRHIGVGRPLTRAELEGLAALYLPEWASRSESFGDGLAWVTAPIKLGSQVQIIFQRFRAQDQEAHFEIHDYVAASRAREWLPA